MNDFLVELLTGKTGLWVLERILRLKTVRNFFILSFRNELLQKPNNSSNQPKQSG